jgi:hypothetical protein
MNLSGWYRLSGTRGLKSAGGGLKLIWPGPRLLILGIHIQRECGNLPAGLQAAGNSTSHQQLSQVPALAVGATRQPPHRRIYIHVFSPFVFLNS